MRISTGNKTVDRTINHVLLTHYRFRDALPLSTVRVKVYALIACVAVSIFALPIILFGVEVTAVLTLLGVLPFVWLGLLYVGAVWWEEWDTDRVFRKLEELHNRISSLDTALLTAEGAGEVFLRYYISAKEVSETVPRDELPANTALWNLETAVTKAEASLTRSRSVIREIDRLPK